MNGPGAAALCAMCQRGQPTANCGACLELRDAHRLLSVPHTALGLTAPDTITVVESGPGRLVLRRRSDPLRGIVIISLGIFMTALTTFVAFSTGRETYCFVIPLVLLALAAVGFGIRDFTQRQHLTLDGGVLTFAGRSSKGPNTVQGIEQLIVDARHVSYWHKGLRWHTLYHLHARTSAGMVRVMSGTHAEARFVEAMLESALRITDDPTRNAVTATSH